MKAKLRSGFGLLFMYCILIFGRQYLPAKPGRRRLRSDDDREEDATILLVALIVGIMVVAVMICYNIMSGKRSFEIFSTYVPQASCNIFIGVVLGLLLTLFDSIQDAFSFDSNIFFECLLPPIIFSAAFLIRKDVFFYNFGTILTYAFVGTAICAFFTGGIIYAVSNNSNDVNFDFDYTESMIFSSLISATDPVATIAILEKMHCDESLFMLIFGEAVLNDAVAIVFFEVFSDVAEGNDELQDKLPTAVLQILVISFVSISIGLIVGLSSAYSYKHLNLRENPEGEIALFIVVALLPYYVAEVLGFSGIMALLFCGFMMDNYTYYHLSDASKVTISNIFRMIAVLIESFVFVYLGMALFDEDTNDYDAQLIFLTVSCCIVARFISVFGLTAIINCFRKRPVNIKYQLMMWFAGLRGPVAFALALISPSQAEKMTSATLVIVFLTTVILGGLSAGVLEALGIRASDNDSESEEDSQHSPTTPHDPNNAGGDTHNVIVAETPSVWRTRNSVRNRPFSELGTKYSKTRHWFLMIDRRYLRPVFGNPLERVDFRHHERMFEIRWLHRQESFADLTSIIGAEMDQPPQSVRSEEVDSLHLLGEKHADNGTFENNEKNDFS